MATEPELIGEAWDDPVLQTAIGKFMIQFSQLEFPIKSVLAAYLTQLSLSRNLVWCPHLAVHQAAKIKNLPNNI